MWLHNNIIMNGIFFRWWVSFSSYFNPFTLEPPVRIHVLSSIVCISFDGQGQLCLLTCAEWRDLSNHTRMSTIQSRTPEKKAKNHVTLTWKFPWKSSSTTHLLFLSSYPKILIAFLFKLFPPKWSLPKCPQEKKKMRQEKWKRGEGRKRKEKSRPLCRALKPKNYLEILLSVHAWTSQANILHLDQKAVKCTTCKQLCGKF